MDYSLIMLEELQKLENLSEDYKGELKFLSKKIRKDFWNTDYNTEKLAKLLHIINGTYEMVFNYIGYFELSCIIEYVKLLAKYCCVICPDLNADYYNQLIDDIHMENARIIIEEQWKDITASEDGLKSFKEIFDDVFTKCLNGNRDKFFHKLKDTDVLCRVVDDKLPINRESHFCIYLSERKKKNIHLNCDLVNIYALKNIEPKREINTIFVISNQLLKG
mgnify:CR=1 FL=1